MQGYLNGVTEGTAVLLVLSVILFAGFIMTRLTNTLNLPKVSGYILAGILIGPCGLNMVPESLISHMGFVSDLALAFIAFGVGKFFKKEVIMKTGKKIIIITIFEALTAGVLVTLFSVGVFHLDLDFALILGAIATATAPASTMMTINQYKAKGEFVNTLLQIVALDDVVCLLAFSVVAAIAGRDATQEFSLAEVMLPVLYNILALGLGFFCGYFLSRLLIPARSKDNRLILAIAMLLGISGICASLDISPLLSCMMFGAAYINLTSDKKLYRQINNFTPPVMSIFFIVSGMNLDVKALTTVGAIGVGYFVVRIIGKYLGTYISCIITKTSPEIRNYMGLALIPQAGVAIGLAFLGERLLPPDKGNLLLTIILSSSVLYEMVGPVCAKASLFLSGCITTEKMKEVNAEMVRENQGSLEEADEGDSGEENGFGNLEGNVMEDMAEEAAGDTAGDAGEGDEGDTACRYGDAGEDGSAVDGRAALDERGAVKSYSGKEMPEDDEEPDDPESLRDGASDGNAEGEEHPDMEHALITHIREVESGVEDEDDYDIEREVQPEKPKAGKKGKGKKKKK